MIVLDASAAIEMLRRSHIGWSVAQRLEDPTETLHAPHLLSVEVAQVLRRHAARGSLSERRAQEAIQDLTALEISRYDHEPFLERMWALRDNLTAYDAVYVALAEALDAPLVTLDQRIANAPGHRARVELLA